MWERISPYYYILMAQANTDDHRSYTAFHSEIFDAFKNKDPSAIKNWTERDLTEARDILIARMKDAL